MRGSILPLMPLHGKHHPVPPERTTPHPKAKIKKESVLAEPADVSKGPAETPVVVTDPAVWVAEKPPQIALPGRRYHIRGREIFAKEDGWYYRDTGEPVPKSHEVQ